MPTSARLRLSDYHAIHRLTGECRELGDDAAAWRRHLFAGLAALVGAGVVMGGEVAGVRAGQTTHTGLTDWGWGGGFDRRGWDLAMAEMAADPSLSRTPGVAAYMERVKADDGVCLSRADLLPDGDWYRGWDYENLHRPIGVDHVLWCFRGVPGAADEFDGLLAARASREPDFTPRQKAVVWAALASTGPLVGGPLARFADPSPSALPPRTRQVLRCLLEGDGDKQVAARLDMARLTVNQHVKRIFVHFRANSRAELLSRWVRRGWPIGGWAETG